MCPFPGAVESGPFGGQLRFLIEEFFVDLPEFMQVTDPLCCLLLGADAGECQRQPVEGAPGIGAGPAGGVAADDALGVDEAALDLCLRPAVFDRA